MLSKPSMKRAKLMTVVKATGCAEQHGGFVFLCDPKWGDVERAQVEALYSEIPGRKSKIPEGWLCVPTGGTSGGVRFARHDEKTLSVAVRGFCKHFGIERVNAVDVLPPHHVSGLMSRVRCAATGGEHVAWDWKQLEDGGLPWLTPSPDGWVISLVSTQLQRLLASIELVAWLRKFRVILLGGGPIWPELAAAAAHLKLPLTLSYGMTETAAMVTALRPEEFLAGARDCGTALPHARITLNKAGVVTVAGESLFRGYFSSAAPKARKFTTEDLGRIDEHGHLHVLGRRDAMIITGGKKVQPAEVEAVLRASGEFTDVVVIGIPDPEWGEAVVACYPAGGRVPDFKRSIKGLPGHQRPKRFVAVEDWPRNAQGKINHTALTAATSAAK